MAYSDLLAQQEKELERLNQDYYVDHATIKNLQNEHYDKTRYDGQLERLQELHERKVKELQTRFTQEQREYLGEPTPPAPLPDISQSQDKAAGMIKDYRQQQADREKKNQEATKPDKPTQAPSPTASTTNNPKDEDIKKMMDDTKKRRQAWQYRRGGHKR